MKPYDVVGGGKLFEETRRFLLQERNENAVMLYRQAARTLLYNLTMIMFYSVKGSFLPTSQTIIHLSQSSTPQFWEEGYIMASNICFSRLCCSICSMFSFGLLSTDVEKYDHFSHSIIYRMIQEKRSTFWKVIIWAIGRKNVHMNACMILKC